MCFSRDPTFKKDLLKNICLKIHKVSIFIFIFLYVYKGYVFKNNFHSAGKVLIDFVRKFFFIFTCVFYDIPPFHYMLKFPLYVKKNFLSLE